MADALDAELLDRPAARHQLGRLGPMVERLTGPNVAMALACFSRRRSHRAMFTDGEQVGLPYAALCWLARHRPVHLMIGHRLSARKKVLLHRALRLHRRVDRLIVYASAQRRFAIEALGYPPERVVLHPFMVDTEFWRPERVTATPRSRPMICAVGQELRDYPTMAEAVRGLDVDVVIAAASPWSKREDTSAAIELPPNVTVGAYDQFDLRQLYADASLVVVPLQETDFQAGITTILEAMSMARPIVCTRTTGQTDTIVEGETGRYVPPRDAAAMREAITDLLADPGEAARLAVTGQDWVRANADIVSYARELATLLVETDYRST
jgi:glycosyltransferase involved in cell wall biosynthesis